jgi:hypothetical protein
LSWNEEARMPDIFAIVGVILAFAAAVAYAFVCERL